MKILKNVFSLIGRIILSIPFIVSLVFRFTDFKMAVELTRANGLTMFTEFWVWAATILEIIGVISLLSGYKIEIGAISLLIFMIPVTLIFHDFWTYTGMDRMTQMGYFISNIALIGGLVLLLGTYPDKFSLDNIFKKKTKNNCAQLNYF